MYVITTLYDYKFNCLLDVKNVLKIIDFSLNLKHEDLNNDFVENCPQVVFASS
jgi:hypothetical protein